MIVYGQLDWFFLLLWLTTIPISRYTWEYVKTILTFKNVGFVKPFHTWQMTRSNSICIKCQVIKVKILFTYIYTLSYVCILTSVVVIKLCQLETCCIPKSRDFGGLCRLLSVYSKLREFCIDTYRMTTNFRNGYCFIN